MKLDDTQILRWDTERNFVPSLPHEVIAEAVDAAVAAERKRIVEIVKPFGGDYGPTQRIIAEILRRIGE